MAYFVYGKRQTKFTPMIAGVMLCIYPYFIDSLLWQEPGRTNAKL
jgi:hypothetical protein